MNAPEENEARRVEGMNTARWHQAIHLRRDITSQRALGELKLRLKKQWLAKQAARRASRRRAAQRRI
jgi:hypothetical protein